MPMRIAGVLGASTLLSFGDAAAQCVMCSLTAEAVDAEGASRTLATAILVLLLPTLGLLGGALALLWKYRGGGMPSREDGLLEAPLPESGAPGARNMAHTKTRTGSWKRVRQDT